MTKAFLTGSRAYGEPTEDSDIDLVILCGEGLHEKLLAESEAKDTVRFGRLNLICCNSKTEYLAWAEATRKMIVSGRNFSSNEARKVLNKVHEEMGIEFLRKSGREK